MNAIPPDKAMTAWLSCLALGLVLTTSGCTNRGPYTTRDAPPLENETVFVALDKPTHKAVACTGVQESRGPDGELRLVAQLQNRTATNLRVEVSCVFKDAQGFATVESSPYGVVYFSAHSQEQVTFRSKDATAERYTIRARQPRD